MLLNITITVQNPSITYSSEGMPTIVWSASNTTERSNIQPLSGEIAFKDYGISDAGATHLFFTKTSSAATEGGRIIYGSKTYDIYRVEQYPNHFEIIVRPVVG
jgi:hypothetical protein